MSPPLEHLELELERGPGPLLPQVRRALAELLGPDAQALRWAITGINTHTSTPTSTTVSTTAPAPARLTLEAVILRMPL
jgi:hypothetical protein